MGIMDTFFVYIYQNPTYQQAIQQLGLKRISDWLAYPHQQILSHRTGCLWRIEMPCPLPHCYLKYYFYPTISDRLKIAFRGGLLGRCRARVEFDNLMRLNQQSLAPQVVAFGIRRRWGFLTQAILVVQEVADVEPLDDFAAHKLKQLNRQQRRCFIERLAAFTQAMNREGFINGQFFWRNILVSYQPPTGFGFQVIDPSSSRRWARWFAPYYDLACLDIAAPYFFSRTERLFFLGRYLGIIDEGKVLIKKHKSLIKKILNLEKRLAPREQKRLKKILNPNLKPQ